MGARFARGLLPPSYTTTRDTTGLHGPHKLSPQDIDAVVRGRGPGAYALGNSSGDTFNISYVGRSDEDLNARLKTWVGSYPQFKYGFLDSSKLAFEKECHLFHDFGETSLDNKIDPARPNGTNWKSPALQSVRLVEISAASPQ